MPVVPFPAFPGPHPALMGDTIVVVRPDVITDGSGNAAFDWATPVRQELAAAVQPAPALQADNQALHGSWQVFTTIDADVAALDRIEWKGDLYELSSDVYRWEASGSSLDYSEFTIGRGEIPPYPDLVTVRRPGTTRDAEHNPVKTTTVVGTTPGLLAAPAPGGEGLVAAQAGLEVDAEVSVPVGTDVKAGDLLVVAGKGSWDVVHVLADRFVIRARVTRSEL